MSAYYSNVKELRADQDDDGILNQSTGDFSDNTAMPGSVTLTGVASGDLTHDNTNVACFVAGTRIATRDGLVPVEDLVAGQMVPTLDSGYQPVRHVMKSTVSGRGALAPIVFAAGDANAHNDLAVSPMHRMLRNDWKADLLFGDSEVLIAAKHLGNGKTIYRAPWDEVTYVHVLFDSHEIIIAEGVRSESYHPGAMAAHCPETLAELRAIFADEAAMFSMKTARRCLLGHEARLLLAA